MDNPFSITLYDKHLTRTGWVNDPLELSVTPTHNKVGTATLTVASNHRRLNDLRQKGARLVIRLRGEHLMSGYITGRAGQGPTSAGQFTFTIQDDLWLMWRILGWPAPGSPITAQGTKQDVRTGPAETVAKAYVAANLTHNRVDPITAAPDLGRGTSISPPGLRMTNLADTLMTLVDTAGIGLSARQVGSERQGTSILLDAYVPTVYPHTLSEAAGTITNWSFSDDDATMTRGVVGGPLEGTSRQFQQVIAALEADYGYTNEGFIDAASSESSPAALKVGQDSLAENGPKAGFTVELAENATFRYGGDGGVHVGDRVPIDVGGNVLTDVLRGAKIGWSVDNAFTAEPTIGEHTDDPDVLLAAYVDKVGRGLDNLRTR